MSREVIVLTPDEWANRESLAKFAQQSYNHNHFNKDAQLFIRSNVRMALMKIRDGDIEDAVEYLNKIPEMCDRIMDDSRRAQDGIAQLCDLISYTLKFDVPEKPKAKRVTPGPLEVIGDGPVG